MNTLPTILDQDLPLETAMRFAVERGQILQSDGRRCILHTSILPGFTRYVGCGEINREGDAA